jgi:putative pyruvate formate lyase activating enzyme
MSHAAARAAEPAYLALLRRGELAERARFALERLARCDLCARYCRVDRQAAAKGAICRTGRLARVASYGPHHGEERPLSGRRGSGTIFFAWCSLRCDFCQNWEISRRGMGEEVDAAELATMMLELQESGCHNVNFVTPGHVVAQILEAVAVAAQAGLRIPLVYNTGGYDSLEALALLDGVVDIYMPDLKYGSSEVARRFSHAPDYLEVNRRAVREMHRQVGDLVTDEWGLAVRGLLVRHLVLPGDLAGTEDVLDFVATELSPDTYLSLMTQYRPCYRAAELPPLDRRPTGEELQRAVEIADRLGLRRRAS